MYLEDGRRGHLASYHVLVDTASNTAVRMPSRPSMRFRPRLAAICAKSGPITTPRFGEGGGPDARSWANQALAASVSSCAVSVRAEAAAFDRLARRGAGEEKARCRRPLPRHRIVRLPPIEPDVECREPASRLQ